MTHAMQGREGREFEAGVALDLVLVEEHVWDAVLDEEAPTGFGTDEGAFDDVDLRGGALPAGRRLLFDARRLASLSA